MIVPVAPAPAGAAAAAAGAVAPGAVAPGAVAPGTVAPGAVPPGTAIDPGSAVESVGATAVEPGSPAEVVVEPPPGVVEGAPVVVVDRPPVVEGKVPPLPPFEGAVVEVEGTSADEPAPPQPVSTAPAIITRKATAAAPDFVPNFVPNLECFCIPGLREVGLGRTWVFVPEPGDGPAWRAPKYR